MVASGCEPSIAPRAGSLAAKVVTAPGHGDGGRAAARGDGDGRGRRDGVVQHSEGHEGDWTLRCDDGRICQDSRLGTLAEGGQAESKVTVVPGAAFRRTSLVTKRSQCSDWAVAT